MKKNFLSKIVSIILVALLIIPQVTLGASAANDGQPQTRGVAASILSGATLTSDNNSPVNVTDKYNFTLKITGTALAEIGMDDKKIAVFAVPPELLGKVTPKSKIIVDATFLPIALKDITAIATPLAAVGKAVDTLVAVGTAIKPVSIDLKFIKTAYDTMISQNISSYHAEITATASADGRMIYANFNDDLNTHVVNSLQKLITTFSKVLERVPTDVVALQAPLTALKSAINTLKAGLTVATIGPSLNANFLSTTTASLAVEVANPTAPSSVFKGDILSNSTIEASLFDGLGGSTTIAFSTPWDNYTAPVPTVNPVNTKSTEVTGTISLTGAPAGTTFEAKITIGSNPEQTVTVDSSGNFSYPIAETLSVGDTVSVVVTAANGGETKDSTPVTVTITDGSTPWDNYTAPVPTVNPVNTKSTEVTGTISLLGAPAGTTFEAKITIGSGTEKTVTVDSSGNFSYPITETMSTGDIVSVIITAANGGETKDSTPVTVTITDGSTPWDNYTAPVPTVNPVNTKSTEVTGTISLAGAPAGTTFEAKITIGSNPEQTVTVDSSGNFSYPITEAMSTGDIVSVIITATNGGETKDSTPVTVTITDGSTPWDSYTAPVPTVNPVNTKSTEVTGTISLAGAPAGTTFEAKITIGSGTEKTVTVDSSGNFTYTITEALSVGDTVSVVVTATNTLGETKDSTPVTVTITDGSTPWDNYTAPVPTVNPVNTKSTEVTGTISLTGAPAGTTFEAKITIGSGTEKTVTVDSSGNFTYTITEALSVGDTVSVVVTATNTLGETKDSTPVTVTITDGSTPWDSYTAPVPTVNPVNTKSTEVTGTISLAGAPAGTTFEAKITIGSGTKKTVTVDSSGNFSYPITETLSVGDTVSVVVTATNGGETKDSTPVTVTITDGSTPWDNYTAPVPTVNPVNTKSTEVTGTISLTGAPAGTTFEAKITIGSGTEKTVTVDSSGNFTYTITEALSVGDTVSVVVTATNTLGETKDSTPVTVTITDGSTPWDSYTAPVPTVNPVNTKSTEVTGTISLAGAPAGTTFEAKITIGSNPEQTVTVDSSGNFTSPITETMSTGDIVSVIITATNGGETKDSTPVTVTITDGSTPWDNYTAPVPTVNPVNTKSTEVTGTISLTGAPAGTTFEAKITIGSGTEKTVTVDSSGNFSYPITETLSVGDTVSVVVTATNGGETKDSTPVTVTITDGSTPWDSYTAPVPTVNPVNTKSTEVTGTISLTGAPAGTTFEAKITIGSGTEKTVTVDSSGNFSYPITEALSVGDTVSVVVTATNTLGETKDSTPVTVTITDGSTPWDNYTAPVPTVNPVNTKSTEVTGTISLLGAPAGTTFEAKITIGSGTPQTVTVDPSGNFTYTITEALSVGDTVSVVVTATNGGETKDSTPVTVTITDGSTPWDNYTAPVPTVNPVNTKSTEVTGTISLAGAPAGTTFEAKITIGSGTEKTVTVDSSGNFSYPITEALSVGDTVSVVVTATNTLGETKDSTPVTVTITDGSTPWDSYTAPVPTVNPVNTKSTEVTGTISLLGAPAGTTFEAKITIGSGTEKTVTVDGSGNFTSPITDSMSTGDIVSVIITATNTLGETKDSTPVTVTITDGSTPWDSYTAPVPTVNPVNTKSTEVTGTISLTGAPAGTTFEAKITIGSGTPQPVTIDPSGDFSHPVTEPLILGETVTVVVTATNGGETKTATGTVTIDDGGRMVLGASGSSRRSGGSSKADMPSSIPSAPSSNANIYWGCLSGQLNPLTLTQATELFNTSLQNMQKNTTTLVLRAYNKTDVDISVLNSLKAMADKNGVCVIIHFDYIINKSVVSRIQVNPETATKSINLCLVARKHNLPKTNYLIKTYGDNVLRLEFAQKINFGVNTSVTIKLPQNYKGDCIDFYQLNSATGKYTQISPVYSIDSKGYLTFNISTTEHIYICGN